MKIDDPYTRLYIVVSEEAVIYVSTEYFAPFKTCYLNCYCVLYIYMTAFYLFRESKNKADLDVGETYSKLKELENDDIET